MRRPCDECGRRYEAKRADSKFCSTVCRGRANNRRKRQREAGLEAASAAPALGGGLVAATRAELGAGERSDTVLGRAALALAARLDAASDSGASTAALVRELRATMTEAMRGVAVAGDPLDELAQRRANRRGA